MFSKSGPKISDISSAIPADKERGLIARKTFQVIQDPRTEKENLTTRQFLKPIEHEAKRKKMVNKSVQTAECSNITVTAEDLTSEEASEDYWRILAEKRGAALDESFKENEKLTENVDLLQQQVQTRDAMLEESRSLVELLKEIISQGTGEGESEDQDV